MFTRLSFRSAQPSKVAQFSVGANSHGASTHLMSVLFKMRPKLTYKCRRDLGVRRFSGQVYLPDDATCERIHHVWRSIADPAPRVRYFQLHQVFAQMPIAVLEAVIRDFKPLA